MFGIVKVYILRAYFSIFLALLLGVVMGLFIYSAYRSSGLSPSTEAVVVAEQDENAVESVLSFDIVRIDEHGYMLVAGRSSPLAEVEILVDGVVIASVVASSSGEWVYQHSEVLQVGSKRINIREHVGGVVTDGDKSLYLTVTEPSSGDYLAVVTNDGDGISEILYRKSVVIAVPLVLDSIDYNDDGRVILQGRGAVGEVINLYLDNRLVGQESVGLDGRWVLLADERIADGIYTLRLDMVDSGGVVSHRLEVPFQRVSVGGEALDGTRYRIIVQPGNSLWRLARRTLGSGNLYTVIYEQNRGQIKDPDLIYPGQIFEVKK